MDVGGLSLGIDMVVSILFGAIGAVGVWFKLKGTVNIQEVKIVNLEEKLDKSEKQYELDKRLIHKRIDAHKLTIDKNRVNSEKGIQEVKVAISEMELAIVKEIHLIGKG